ncbi:hypothetical protein Thiowin_01452 [Thiorhodovibrio winogradskyi]|uniref:DUF2281 domain-containing protein n=1 Tax=Thiorhodovibrio winogradskyi TaxID=77007 RepID=A0ABZ0S8N0_9GAMM|nr:DUF2281 domain-containing protein [Thiorhodovibrio winogradskyi]
MEQAELLETLEQLPVAKQAEVLDFARFLVERARKDSVAPKTLRESSLAQWINQPLNVKDFQPLTREEANAR